MKTTPCKLALAGLAFAASAAALSAQTVVAHWTFDDPDNLGYDSSGNALHLTLPTNPGVSYNEGRLSVGKASSNYLAAPDNDAFTMNSLTLEVVFELTERSGTNLGFLAGHFYGANNTRSYALALDSNAQIRVVLAQSNTATQYETGYYLTPGTNYYLAFSVNTSATPSERSLTFYIKDLSTEGSQLQTVSWTGAAVTESFLLNSTTNFSIGAQGNGSGADIYSGYFDEVRLSAGVLSEGQLLIAIPEPSAFAGLAGLGAVVIAGARRRRRRT
jgi:PEP-CTERM putative exosortase interaction domain